MIRLLRGNEDKWVQEAHAIYTTYETEEWAK